MTAGLRRALPGALLISIILATAACANTGVYPVTQPDTGETGGDDPMRPFAPYSETVTIGAARHLNLGNALADGVTTSDNIYIDVIRDRLNVDVIIDWETTPDDYPRRLDLAIAGDSLPDVFILQSNQYLTFKWLVENGKLADLTDAYEKCIGGYDALYLNSMDGSQNALCIFDGRLMGIPQIPTGYNFNLLWVRGDWLKKLGLQAPKTLDEIRDTALSFIKNKTGGSDTQGIVVDPQIILGGSNNFLSLSTVANALGAYPTAWVYDGDGKAAYGGVSPKMKDALRVLRDWYKEGVLDPKFMDYPDMNAVTPAIRDGRCGLFFGAYWSPWIVAYGADDADKQWIPVYGPVDANGVFNHTDTNNPTAFLVVGGNCAYPEAAIKSVNVAYELQRGAYNDDPAIKAEADRLTAAGCFGRTINPFPGALSNMFDEEVRRGVAYMNYCETGVLDPIPGLPLDAISEAAEKCLSWHLGDRTVRVESDLDNRIQYESYEAIAGLYHCANRHNEPEAYTGTTKSMGEYWTALNALERLAAVSIITGERPPDYFEQFVAEWKAAGGDIITAEVNAAINRK